MKILENISLWWRHEARYYHRDLIEGIKNLIRWFPIIWKDRDWDHSFIFNLLIKKLELQSKYIGTRDRHTTSKRNAEIMVTCVELLKRIRDEYYLVEYTDYQDVKYEFVDCEMLNCKELKVNEISEKFEFYFKKYPRVYKRVLSENPESTKSKIAFLIGIKNHERAKKTLFKLMENHVEGWWS